MQLRRGAHRRRARRTHAASWQPRPLGTPAFTLVLALALALTVTLTLTRVGLTLAPTLPLNPEPDRLQATMGAHRRRSKRRCRRPRAPPSALPSALPSSLPRPLPSTRPSGARSAARTASPRRSGSVGSNETARGLWRSELRLCPRATLGAGGGEAGGAVAAGGDSSCVCACQSAVVL